MFFCLWYDCSLWDLENRSELHKQGNQNSKGQSCFVFKCCLYSLCTGGNLTWCSLHISYFSWLIFSATGFSAGLVNVKSHCFPKISCNMASFVFKINNLGSLQIPGGHASVPRWLDKCSLLCSGCKYLRHGKELWSGTVTRCSYCSSRLSCGMANAGFPVLLLIFCATALGVCCEEQREQMDTLTKCLSSVKCWVNLHFFKSYMLSKQHSLPRTRFWC